VEGIHAKAEGADFLSEGLYTCEGDYIPTNILGFEHREQSA
jgi:hypothetical protein